MKPFEYYSTIPGYPDVPTKPLLSIKATPSEIRQHADDMDNYLTEYAAYKNAMHEYAKKRTVLNDEFKADALAEAGLTYHPRADKIYWYAYERGHSSGYEAVYNELMELSELFDTE